MSRKGPSEPKLGQVGRNTIAIDRLEITNGSSGYSCARANVFVSSGKYYYEVRVVSSGSMRIGWSTESWPGSDYLGNDDQSWGYDGSQCSKYHDGNGSSYSTESWSQGDIIGCALDLDLGTISYTRNCEPIGTAFDSVRAGVFYTPSFSLSRRQRLVVNFGKEEFCSKPPGFFPLLQLVSDADIGKLKTEFIAYSKMSGDGAEAMEPPVVRGEGLLALGKDLGLKSDTDPLLLILFWKLGCSGQNQQWSVNESEFVMGMVAVGVASMSAARDKLAEWRRSVYDDDRTFETFYNWVFEYLRAEGRSLSPELCHTAWQILGMETRWPLFGKWEAFVKAKLTRAMSRDTWQQIIPFSRAYPADVKDYDPAADWPTLMDEFVDWLSK
eukprot:m51a1_g3463 hypothetical protein (383) ;mRNA; f:731290-732966